MSVQPSPGPRPLVNSGQAWLGPIPQHWTTKRIKFQFSCVGGGTPSKDETSYWAGIIPWASPKDFAGVDLLDTEDHITEEAVRASATRVVAPGSLLMVVRSGVLRHTIPVAINRVATALNQDLKALVPGSLLQPEYLKYLIVGKNDQLLSHWSQLGCTVESLDTERVLNTPVPVPPRHEQAAIVRFLDRETARIDALIEKKRRLIVLLQEKRAAALTKAVTAGLDSSVTTINSGKASIGVIPSHWKVKRLKHVSPRLMVGVVVNPSSFVAETGKPFLLGSNIKEGRILWKDAAKIDDAGNRANAKSILRAGDLVTVRVGAPGVTAVVPDEVEGGNAASVMIIRGHRSFDSQWLCHVMNSRVLRSQIEIVQYGAAQEQFNISHAVDFWIPVPPLDEQRAIASFIDQRFRAIDGLLDRLSRTIRASLEYRSALIAAAVTGQIDVREAA